MKTSPQPPDYAVPHPWHDFRNSKPADQRPKKGGWAPGDYSCICRACQTMFNGADKRSWQCADCAYKEQPQPPDYGVAAPTTATGTELKVIRLIESRQRLGVSKYGCTVQGNPLSARQWLQHAIEECADQLVYLQRLADEMDREPVTSAVSGSIHAIDVVDPPPESHDLISENFEELKLKAQR